MIVRSGVQGNVDNNVKEYLAICKIYKVILLHSSIINTVLSVLMSYCSMYYSFLGVTVLFNHLL